MARTRTLAELIDDVRWQGDAEGITERHTDARITRAINQSIQEFRELISDAGHPYYLRQATGQLTTGAVSPYPFGALTVSSLSPAFLRVYGFDVKVRNVWTPLKSVNFEERNDWQRGFDTTGIPRVFFLFNETQVAFAPAADSAYDYILYYLPVLTDLSAGSDTFDGLAGCEEWVIFNATAKLTLRDNFGDKFQAYAAERQRLLEGILARSRQRQHAGATTRTDSRGRVGGGRRAFAHIPQESSGGLTRIDAGSPTNIFNLPYIDARHYCVGDGVTDDKAQLLLANTAGIALGIPVIGAGKTYGVAGNLEMVANTWFERIAFKQLTPDAAGDVRTLTSSGADNITLIHVLVDRNGDGSAGELGDGGGIYISGGSGHYFEDVEVTGDDMGHGFVVSGAAAFEMVRPYVHDMNYLLGADPGDDRLTGILLINCSEFRVSLPTVHDIGGNFGAGATTQYTRGIAIAGCSDFTVVEPQTYNVDQGVDLTGSAGNTRFKILGGHAYDCRGIGFKFANSARDGSVVGAVAERCGWFGFAANGPNDSGLTVLTGDLQFVGCVAYDTGSNGFHSASNPVGFRILAGAYDTDTPRGVRFLSCKAHDRQSVPTMVHGFSNEIAANVDGRYNEVVDCVSIGHITSAFSGMNASRCQVGRAAAQSIPDSAWTEVEWTTETDLGAMHDNAVSNANITTRRAGSYQLTYGVFFAASAAGVRGLRILESGAVIPGSTMLVSAASAGETALNVSIPRNNSGGGITYRIEVFQTSGGALDLQTTSAGNVEQVN